MGMASLRGHRDLPQGGVGATAGLEGGDSALCAASCHLAEALEGQCVLFHKRPNWSTQPSQCQLASEEVARVTFWPRVGVPPAAQIMAP